MNPWITAVWVALCAILAYYSFVRPGHILMRFLVGGAMLAVWCYAYLRGKRKDNVTKNRR